MSIFDSIEDLVDGALDAGEVVVDSVIDAIDDLFE